MSLLRYVVTSPEVVRAGEEGGLGGGVHHPPHAAVVAQGQQLLPASVPEERINM